MPIVYITVNSKSLRNSASDVNIVIIFLCGVMGTIYFKKLFTFCMRDGNFLLIADGCGRSLFICYDDVRMLF